MDTLDLAALLHTYREEKGLNIRDMADRLYMSKSAYDRLEKGLTKPSYEEIARIVKLLNLSADEDKTIYYARNPLSEMIVNLKRGLLYNTIGLMDALKSVNALAKSIGCQYLLGWSEMELTGYPDNPGFSDYRIYPCVYLVSFESGNEKFREFPVAFELLDPEDEKGRQVFLCDRVFGFYEGFLFNDGSGNIPANYLKPLVRRFLRETVAPDARIIGITQKTSGKTIRKVILAVQEILLYFILSLERQFGPSTSIEHLRLHSKEVEALFSEALARTGNAKHLDLPVKFIPYDRENNLDILMDFLYEYVSDEHFDEILDLLEEEEKKGKIPESFGERLAAMVERMAKIYPKFGPEGSRLKDALRGYLGYDKKE